MRKAIVPMKESKEKNKLSVDFKDPTLEMTLSSAKLSKKCHQTVAYFHHNLKQIE